MSAGAGAGPRPRTEAEIRAYLEGFEAGVKTFEERLDRNGVPRDAAVRASAAECREMARLSRETLLQEGR